MGKWLQLLSEVAPNVGHVAIIFDPDTAFVPQINREVEAASSFGMTATPTPVRDDAGIEDAIAAEAREPGGGLVVLP